MHSFSFVPGTPRLGMRLVTGAGVASSLITTLLSQSCKRTHQLATPQLPLRMDLRCLQVSRPKPTPSLRIAPHPLPPHLSTSDILSLVTSRCASSTLILCHDIFHVSTVSMCPQLTAVILCSVTLLPSPLEKQLHQSNNVVMFLHELMLMSLLAATEKEIC